MDFRLPHMGKISIWQRLLSYFREIHIESAPGEVNPHLYVSLSKGRYMLSSARAIYSHGDLYDNFVQTFKKVNWNQVLGDRMLLLGFGLGSIPMILEKQGRDFKYTAVEKDPNVIYLASKYTLPLIQSPVHLYEADAGQFVKQQSPKTFSSICMDIFLEDMIPSHVQKEAFIEKLQALLLPRGVLFVNTLRPIEKDGDEKGESKLTPFQQLLLKVFPQGDFVPVGPNAVFVSRGDVLQ